MSSPVAGKFQDHYVVLGIESRADSETILAAYTKLAQKYHPDNPETGDDRKFDAVNLAYEVLSDPALRIEFDKLKGIDHENENPAFTGAGFFEALKHGARLRAAVLCILYDRRRIRSFSPTMSMRQLESMLQTNPTELHFAMWYLKQRGYVASDDKSSLQITVEGMDYLERNPPAADVVLPLIKPDSIAAANVEAKQAGDDSANQANPGEPVLKALQRALTRGDKAPQSGRAVAVRRQGGSPPKS